MPPVPSLRAVLEPLDEAALRRYRLSETQWAQVRGSRDFRAQPQWRLAQLGGAARTLRGSYRKSYSRLSRTRRQTRSLRSRSYAAARPEPRGSRRFQKVSTVRLDASVSSTRVEESQNVVL